MNSKSDGVISITEEETLDTIELCIISHDATMVAWLTLSGKIKLLSLKSNLVKMLGQHSEASVNLLKFSPKDVLIVSCGIDGSIKVRILNFVETLFGLLAGNVIVQNILSYFIFGNLCILIATLRN